MTFEDDHIADPSRRRLLTGLAVGGAVVVGGVAGAATSALAAPTGYRRESLSIDVACLGHKWRNNAPVMIEGPDDFRSGFSVEGFMYPAGTIPEEGFVPTRDGAIGQWICRGWVVIDRDRREPHATTVQEYMFALITPDELFPTTSITSSGIEGTSGPQISTRAVIGGTGRYMGATGQVTQRTHGTNTTVFFDGSGDNAYNFIFDFDLLIPNM